MATSTIKHLAIIMDGNRRWAKQRNLATHQGHQAGVLALENLVRSCDKRGIKVITAYGFSTENWGRAKTEINWLMKIISAALAKYTDMLDGVGWRVQFIGRKRDFPKPIQSLMDKMEHRLKNNQNGLLVLALSYGGRDEIVRTANRLANLGGKLTEEKFAAGLDTAGLPDPDLIIRTGGHQRLSNFLLWQSAYSELFFSNTLWPDFNSRQLDRIIQDYIKRQRNFGQ